MTFHQEDSGISISSRFYKTAKAENLWRHSRSRRARGTYGHYSRLPPDEGCSQVQTVRSNLEGRHHDMVQGLARQLHRFVGRTLQWIHLPLHRKADSDQKPWWPWTRSSRTKRKLWGSTWNVSPGQAWKYNAPITGCNVSHLRAT